MNVNFDTSLIAVLAHEGGYSNHPEDNGGPTNLGITLASYRKWVAKDGNIDDLRALTRTQAGKVYRGQYWNAVCGDDLPSGLDYAVFDYAVNSGPTRAAKALQRIVGATPDGKIGPATLAAVGLSDTRDVIRKLCDGRLMWLKTLSDWKTFGKGWERRVTDVKVKALGMALEAAGKPTDAPKPVPAPTPLPEASEPVRGGWLALVMAILRAIFSAFRRPH